jgi:hypothetical protein
MTQESPHETFLSNFYDATGKLNDLEEFAEVVSGYFKREAKYFREEAHVDLEITFLPLFAETYPPIHRSSVIIAAVSLVELELRGYMETLRRCLSLKVGQKDLSGSLLDRFRTYVEKIADLNVDWKAIGWDDMNAVFEIRNCLIHAGGSLEHFGHRGTIEAFSKRTNDCPRIVGDRLDIDEAVVAAALFISGKFLDEVYAVALKRF